MNLSRKIILVAGMFFLPMRGICLILETFGDSLTHGIMARTSVEKGHPELVSAMMSDASKYVVTKDLTYLEKYGDRKDAWPWHLKGILESENSAHVQVENFSMVGEAVADLEAQVKQIAFTPSGDVTAFFFMGHNDLCPSLEQSIDTLVLKFKAAFRRALLTWDSLHDGAFANVIPIGNVDEVFRILNLFVWFEGTDGQKYRCNDNWGLYFPYCRKFAVLTKQGKLKEVLRPRIEALNATLEDLVVEMNKRSRKNRYSFLRSVGELAYTPNYFALDCFHLSGIGQKNLAHEVKFYLFR